MRQSNNLSEDALPRRADSATGAPARSEADVAAPLGFGPAFPTRPAGLVEPLIEASAAFPMMERLVLEAEHTAHFAFRLFDPETRLQSDEAKSRGFRTWGDLLVDAARRGVRVRLLLTDFEPVVAHELHELAWQNAERIERYIAQIPTDAPGKVDVLVALHEGEIGFGLRSGLWPAVRQKLKRLVSQKPDAVGFPGVAHLMLASRPRFVPPGRVWPATHHQKLLVVDGRKTVIGGIDIDERRYDDPEHNRPTEQTWHDVSLYVDGPVASDAARHFGDFWNREVTRYGGGGDQLPGWSLPPGHDRQTVPRCIPSVRDTMKLAPIDAEVTDGQPSIRFLRTLSAVRDGPFAITPRPVVTEIEDAFVETIQSATRLLYIENQFFRLRRVADLIGKQMEAHPELEVILLLPMAPDMVAFEHQRGPEMRFGEWLQVRAVRRLIERGGDRFGAFSIVRSADAEPNLDPRAKAFGSGIIYPHAKVMIADDRRALVGSANINGRSFRMDTEAALAWTDDPRIRAFRDRLFETHLCESAPEGMSPLAYWRETADFNRDAEPEDRRGFVVPYQLGVARRFSRFQRFIPEAYL
ncbi:phospholipase D family protein [Amorphus orientalis]|uniref:Phospholipase D n=1 Tax=Amorphus orientalis TaxID=649198 RepID=A0AAE4ATP9_9HYPH|nr:phospholipase D-like domain-containing protein [Amorphus orientalis]MDQ0316362.1 phosphatidylserine/phosphatidylglycerophosphate/cardiolipin synthase-like enzyme [Amorphus orientalis]